MHVVSSLSSFFHSFSSVFLTPTSTSGWEEIQVDLSSYVGHSVSIRFVGSSVYGSSNPSIDDVKVSEPPSYPIADLSTGVLNFGPVYVDGSKSLDFATHRGSGCSAVQLACVNGNQDIFIIGFDMLGAVQWEMNDGILSRKQNNVYKNAQIIPLISIPTQRISSI